jgi:TfoX/Sxy family transcriptional regulator of competence genes
MAWTKVPPEHVALLERLVRPLPGAVKRPMFGCPAYFVNGNMFAGAHQESIILRLAPEDREALLTEPGAAPFTPMPGRTMKEYVSVPRPIYESDEAFRPWLDKAHKYAASLPGKD